jgi:hypothetical protein
VAAEEVIMETNAITKKLCPVVCLPYIGPIFECVFSFHVDHAVCDCGGGSNLFSAVEREEDTVGGVKDGLRYWKLAFRSTRF